MKRNIEIQVVESISEFVAEMQDRIRTRAYENYLGRNRESNRHMDDWLEAERELTGQLQPSVLEEGNRIISEVRVLDNECEGLKLRITPDQMLVSTISARLNFALMSFPQSIDPSGVQAEFSSGTLRLTAPLARFQALGKTA
jgi:hypothetical protein